MMRRTIFQLIRKVGSFAERPEYLTSRGGLSRDGVGSVSTSSGVFSESFQDSLSPSTYIIPDELKPISKQRRRINKLVWLHMRQRNTEKLEVELEKLRSNVVPLDEVTYVHMLFGYLLLPKHGMGAADSVLHRLNGEPFIHESLKTLLSNFVSSLKRLQEFDAFPNRTALLKATIPFVEIASKVKEKRQAAERGYAKTLKLMERLLNSKESLAYAKAFPAVFQPVIVSKMEPVVDCTLAEKSIDLLNGEENTCLEWLLDSSESFSFFPMLRFAKDVMLAHGNFVRIVELCHLHNLTSSQVNRLCLPLRFAVKEAFWNEGKNQPLEPLVTIPTVPPCVMEWLEVHAPSELVLPRTDPVEAENLKQKLVLENAHRIVARPLARAAIGGSQSVCSVGLNLNARFQLYSGPPLAVSIDLTLFPVDALVWPEFHNGVAGSGAAKDSRQFLLADKQKVDQILSNRRGVPGVPQELVPLFLNRHAGLLFALGLKGVLGSLRADDWFRYLKLQNECVSVAVLLGAAVSKASGASQMCFLHIPSVLPNSCLEIPPVVTAAAYAGLGFVHAGTRDLAISTLLVEQLGAARSEACALSAGLALGLVANESPTERLLAMTVNSGQDPSLNVAVLLPGVALAVALLHLGSHLKEWNIPIPQTVSELETEPRADSLLFKCLARGLISPPKEDVWEWLKCQLPVFLRVPEKLEVLETRIAGSDSPSVLDWLAIYQATVFGLTGACVALGTMFAGTQNLLVKSCLMKMLAKLTKLDLPVNHCAAQCASRPSPRMSLDRGTIETCRSSVLLSLSVVMAGSGDSAVLEEIKTARETLSEATSFGVTQAVNQAIGFLFLDGGKSTLSIVSETGSYDAVKAAGVLMAILPRFPASVGDNGASLQALRHLFVLAQKEKKDMTASPQQQDYTNHGAYISEFSRPREGDVRKLLGLSYATGNENRIGGVPIDWVSNQIAAMAAIAFPNNNSERLTECKSLLDDLGGTVEKTFSETYIDELLAEKVCDNESIRLLKDCIAAGKAEWFFDLVELAHAQPEQLARVKELTTDHTIFARIS